MREKAEAEVAIAQRDRVIGQMRARLDAAEEAAAKAMEGMSSPLPAASMPSVAAGME